MARTDRRTAFWRPDWTWRFRQVSCLVLAVWLLAVIPAVALTYRISDQAALLAFGVWILGLIAFGAVINGLGRRFHRAWLKVVAERGWQYQAEAPELKTRWPFMPFTADPDPDVVEVTSGTHRGRRFRMGRFWFGLGKQRVAFDFIDLEVDRSLPAMHVAPESLTGAVAPGLRPMDLHLENEDFNRRYRLLRGDPATVHAVLHPRVMLAMLAVQPFGFVAEGPRFVAVMPGFRRPETALAQLDAACTVVELMPEHVWLERRAL